MRVGRLEVSLIEHTPQFRMPFWYRIDGPCYCRILELGNRVHLCWLSYECLAGVYKDKGRRYRIARYLEKRRKRRASTTT